MNKWGFVAIVSGVGAAAGLLYNYLFGPAPETTFDGSYQSRLDWALSEGEKAASLRELELRAQFEAAKLPAPSDLEWKPEAIATEAPRTRGD